ncbi:type II secretion system protein [Clostridium cylindrosporum]|uniref:Prepilin-type N-terminal cleavage/methylation domain-containing protein n=1 Tax=Clostridium cylindrosporum DSM 605 TaxID=1121307 RepID=A0A0J8D548_CLOCY|nr:type II secretion system protein [Clostridium cylindrosporum]KMT21285.1 hypothetical protein CLCY_2c00450 [Clostridium cylindrosporum DSM 605]
MKKGFTLIEMVIVVAIITILSGVVFLSSLNSFRTSKVEGFSNEALSLISRLYDNQSSKARFLDQINSNNAEATYNIVFEEDNGEIKAKLRDKQETIDEVLISNIASIKDMSLKFKDKVVGEEETRDNIILPKNTSSIKKYILTFDSKGRVVRTIEDGMGTPETKILKSLTIQIGIENKNFFRNIIITTPPAGNIVMEKEMG